MLIIILHQLLRELSERKSELGVANFGLSVTTLNDVFLRAGSNTVLKDEDEVGKNISSQYVTIMQLCIRCIITSVSLR